LIELLVVIAIIALLVTILMPSLSRARELVRRTACSMNLSSLGKALAMYRAEFDESYPWLQECDHQPNGAPNGGKDDIHELMNDIHDNILENLNLLVARGYISYDAFFCPATGHVCPPREAPNKRYGFCLFPDPPSTAKPWWYNDYGYHLGTPKFRGVENPAAFDKIDSNFAIVADADVANKEQADPEWNHGTEGANVLKADYSADFVERNRMNYVTVNGDNIYNNGDFEDETGEPDALPASKTDQVIYSNQGE
jgi:hypothetical protein